MNDYNFTDFELFYILKLFPDYKIEKYGNVNAYYIDTSTRETKITEMVLNNIFNNVKNTYYTNIYFNVFKGLTGDFRKFE